MRNVTYSLGLTLDGYIVGPDGKFDWSAPDEELFEYATDEVRGVDVHLLGRKIYTDMLYWETADQEPEVTEAEREFAELWRALDKVVFSTTLTEVDGTNHRLATGSLADEIEQLRSEGDGDIAIAGATLATQAAALGLIDEYRLRIFPVLVGGGTPFFEHAARRVDLELVSSRTFPTQVVALRYRVKR